MITLYHQHDVAATTLSVKLFDAGVLIDTVVMEEVEEDAVHLWTGSLTAPASSTLSFQVFADAETDPSAFGIQTGLVDLATITLGFTPAPSIPSAAENAAAVRSELSVELDHIDADISSRAAPGAEMDLVDAPNATAVTAIQDGLSTFDAAEDTVTLGADQAVNVTKVAGNSVAGVDDFKADVSSLATTEDLEAVDEIVDAIKAKTDELDFTGTSGMLKAEATNMRGTDGAVTSLSGIATEANATSNAGALAGLIGALNDLDSSDVQDAAAAALTAYDPPTRAEATSDKDAVIAAIPSASANADAVRTELASELDRLDVDVSSRLAPTTPGRTIAVNVDGSVEADVEAAVIVQPLSAGQIQRVRGMNITVDLNDLSPIEVHGIVDASDPPVPVDLTDSGTLRFVIESAVGNDLLELEDEQIEIIDDDNNGFRITPNEAAVGIVTSDDYPRRWALRRSSDGKVLAKGLFKVELTAD